jgi:hypothetical protein
MLLFPLTHPTSSAAVVLCAVAALSQAQSTQAGPRIFVDTSSIFHPTGSGQLEPVQNLDNFNIYLVAAVWKKHLNVIITTDRSKADFILEGVLDHQKLPGWKSSSIPDNRAAPVLPQHVTGHDAASVRLVARSGDVVFVYSVDRNNSIHGWQTAAESIAKHLKSAVLHQLDGGGLQGLAPQAEPTETKFRPHVSLLDRIKAFPSDPY